MREEEHVYLSQEEHISMLQQCRKENVHKAAERINKMYLAYMQGDDSVFSELIEAIDKMYIGMVRRKLRVAGCYDEENEHVAMQESRLAVWMYIQKCRREDMEEISFASYCKGIYYHKVQDVIRSVLTTKSHFGDQVYSMDNEVPSGNSTIGDFVADPRNKGNRPDIEFETGEKRVLFHKLYTIYCQALMESDAVPPRSLALYYARILPHILHIDYNIDTIPDMKVSSPKWARERMENKTIGKLGTESESELKQYIDPDLHWCDSFYCQLEERTNSSAGFIALKDVIYTKEYDEKKIGHWTDYMHKIISEEWLRRVMRDSELKGMTIEYTEGMHKLSKLTRGGVDR